MNEFMSGLLEVVVVGVKEFLSIPGIVVYRINRKITKVGSDFLWRYRTVIGSVIWISTLGTVIYSIKGFIPLEMIQILCGSAFITASMFLGLVSWYSRNAKRKQ